MKRLYALMLTIMLLLAMTMPVYAGSESPKGDPTEDKPGESSPKTGDLSMVTIGLAGGVCAVTSFAAAKKSKREE